MPVGIDLFAGAGGLSLGATRAGVSVRFAVEKDYSSAETYAYNHPDVNVICEDIRNIDPQHILDRIRLEEGEDVYVVFGGPPCQGFSSSNTRTRNAQNPSNYLFEEFIRFVTVIQPRWVLFENVEGIVGFEGGKTLRKIVGSFERLGYTVRYSVLTASDYGVPQNRNRFILVGNRAGIPFTFPGSYGRMVTVSDAIDDLPILRNGDNVEELPYRIGLSVSSEYARKMRAGSKYSLQNYVSRNSDYVIERYSYIQQGQNWRALPAELMTNYSNSKNCHSGIYRRLLANRPSVVISNYRKNMLIHPYQDRGLSVREAARLQSFPDNFYFKGTLMSIQQQIGNAVPPLLAQAVFDQIMCLDNAK